MVMRIPRSLFAAVSVLALASSAAAEVILTEKAALERAYPGLETKRRTVYLTHGQTQEVEKVSGSKLPSPVVTVFEARAADGHVEGRACLDTHVVRTMPESVLTALNADGQLRMALVLQFGEPSDYLPRERWLRTLEGKSVRDPLRQGRDVPRVTGSTLTVEALTAAVRRCLALEERVLRGVPAEPPPPSPRSGGRR
jgi:hypothetical protein